MILAVFLCLIKNSNIAFCYDNLASLSAAIINENNKSTSNSNQYSYTELSMFSNPYIAFDLDSSCVLFEKNIDEKVYPASLTKIFTTLLFVENSNMRYSKNNDLAYKTLYKSDNDAANRMADQITGGVNSFVKLMNSRIKKLDLHNTHFDNPSGLHSSNHYTTARDFSQICKEAYMNKEFMNLFSNVNYTNSVDESISYSVGNKMMKRGYKEFDHRVFAGKNGFTKYANHTLASFAKVDNKNVLILVFNESEDNCYNITKILLDNLDKSTNIVEEESDSELVPPQIENTSSDVNTIYILISVCLIIFTIMLLFHGKIFKIMLKFVRKMFDYK